MPISWHTAGMVAPWLYYGLGDDPPLPQAEVWDLYADSRSDTTSPGSLRNLQLSPGPPSELGRRLSSPGASPLLSRSESFGSSLQKFIDLCCRKIIGTDGQRNIDNHEAIQAVFALQQSTIQKMQTLRRAYLEIEEVRSEEHIRNYADSIRRRYLPDERSSGEDLAEFLASCSRKIVGTDGQPGIDNHQAIEQVFFLHQQAIGLLEEQQRSPLDVFDRMIEHEVRCAAARVRATYFHDAQDPRQASGTPPPPQM